MIIIQNIKDSNHILYINNQSKFYYKEGNERDRNLNTFDKILNNYSSDDFITYRGEFWTYINFNQENPIQGWKIHISATIENYLTVFDLVSNYCINNKIDFKYVKDVRSLRLSQDKSYSRESSGKFIVIYPKYNIIHNVLSDLYDILRGFKGQYILSDKRFKDSQCIYYRYGEILPIYQLNDRGIKETFILNDKNGNYLNKGEKALEYDLSNLIIDEDGNLGLNREGENSNKEVLSPYLYEGLAGLGSVVIRYYKVTKDKKYLDVVEAITKSLDINFTIFPSYMRGLSGIIHYHLDVYQFRKSENSRRIAKKLIDNLFLYEDKEYPGLYAGEQLFRLSNDFSTGSPGITTAIVRYLDSLSGIGMNNNFYLDEFYLEMMDEI